MPINLLETGNDYEIIACFQQIDGPLKIHVLLISSLHESRNLSTQWHACIYFPSHALFMYTVLINHFLHPETGADLGEARGSVHPPFKNFLLTCYFYKQDENFIQ